MATSSFTKNFVVTKQQFEKSEKNTKDVKSSVHKVSGFVSKLTSLDAIKLSLKNK